MNYWLVKSEPDCFSIEDLANAPHQISPWDGVRNYQARNFMRDDMKKGDLVFFYHSSCKIPAIVGTALVVKESYPDFTAFDPSNEHWDPKSDRKNPRWFMVDIQLKEIFTRPISLTELKKYPELSKMRLLQRGNRLSVMPISFNEWTFILNLVLR